MAFQSRFFGSAGGDPRDYNQLEFAEWVLSSKSSGYVPEEGNELQVMESSPAAMTVDVDTGQGYVQGYFAVNDVLEEVTIDPSHATLDRIDTVVMNLDILSTRLITPVVLLGTPAATPVPPTLQQDTNVWQVALADVLVAALAVSIVDADITDRREQVEGKHTHNAMEENTTHSTSDGSSHSIVISNQDKIDNSFNMSPETYIGNVGQQDDPINSEYTTVLGTQTQDTTNVKVGSEALRITENDNTAGFLSSKKTVVYDYSVLNNGSDFVGEDYFNFIANISDVSLTEDLIFIFRTDASNFYTITINTGLVTGHKTYSVLKSSAVATLSPVWANITEIEIGWTSLINAINEFVVFNTFLPVIKDPSLTIPNPFQQFGIADNVFVAAGEWIIVNEFGSPSCKQIGIGTVDADASLLFKNVYDDAILTTRILTDDASLKRSLTYFVDDTNLIFVSIESDTLRIRVKELGVNTDTSISYPVDRADIINFKMTKKGTSLLVEVSKNAGSNPISLTASTNLNGGSLAIGATAVRFSKLFSASITEISHAHHSDITELAKSVTTEVVQDIVGRGKNLLINGNFQINQDVVSGTVVLAAGIYGHDGFKAGSGGCTYTFAKSLGITTLTITAGTLLQIVDANKIISEKYTISWIGTATGQLDGNGFDTSPITEVLIGGASVEAEFATGTLTLPKVEEGEIDTPNQIQPFIFDLIESQEQYEKSYSQGTAPNTITRVGGMFVPPPINADGRLRGFRFKVVKRVVPTVSLFASDAAGGAGTVSHNGTQTATVGDVGDSGVFEVTITGSVNTGSTTQFQWTADARP